MLETNADTIHQSQLIEHAKELELWMQNLLMKALFVLITLPFFAPIFCSIEKKLDDLDAPKANLVNNLDLDLEDLIKHIDDTIDEVHKTILIFEGRHVLTVVK